MSNRWTAPITDPALERKIAKSLYAIAPKYGCLYNLAIATGVPVEILLKIRISNISGQTLTLSDPVHTEIKLEKDISEQVSSLTIGRKKSAFLFTAKDNASALSVNTFKKVLQRACAINGMHEAGTNTLRKTHFFHVYQKDGIEAAAKQLGHRSTSLTRQFLGLDGHPSQNCRESLLKDHRGEKELAQILSDLTSIKESLYDPMNPDVFYTNLSSDIASIKRILQKYQDVIKSGATADNV